MSGAADDDSAPSNSTPQSPEGAESTPDVTVTETKPDTPGSHVEDDAPSRTEANETPIDQPSQSAQTMKEENAAPAQEENVEPVKEDVEPAKEENVEPAQEGNTEPAKDEDVSHNDVGKVDMAEGTADAQEPKPGDEEHPQSVSESPVAVEEKTGEPAPETGETEPVKQEEADPLGESKEAPPSESEKGETSESKQPEEPLKEAGETKGTAVADESAKEEEKTEGVTVENTNAETDVTENSATENVNSNDNNDAAEVTAQNPEVEVPRDSDMQEIKSNENDTDPQIQDPVADASNTNSAANEDAPAVNVEDKQGESVEDIPTSSNPDSGTTIMNSSDEVAAENTKVELSELDSLKLDNERLGKKVKELEDEIDRIREGRKEGMKVHATYLARELSQQQDNEKYLKEKLAEVLQEKEESERRVKDLQLRLKRFAKDDQAKDARLAKMESELRDITQEVQILENLLDEDTLRSVQDQRASGKVNGPSGAGTMKNKAQPPPPQSKTCIIL